MRQGRFGALFRGLNAVQPTYAVPVRSGQAWARITPVVIAALWPALSAGAQ